jgi:hypothetical protein
MRRMNCLELVVDGVRIALGPDYGLPSEAPAGDVDTPPDAPGRGRRLTPPEGPILFASSGG